MKYRLYTKTEKANLFDHKENEDKYMFSEFSFMGDKTIRIMVVADGMGGLKNGSEASRQALKGFMDCFYRMILNIYLNADMDNFSLKYSAKGIQRAMIKAMQAANRKVCRAADVFEEMGSTLSAICMIDDMAVIANVGDSPVYYYRKKENSLRLMSELQTKAELDVREGRYKRYSKEYYQKAHILCCSMGQYQNLPEQDISVTAIGNICAGDIFLVGSDGSFGTAYEADIQELLEDVNEETEGFVLNQLFELGRMDKEDDQTAILYVVSGDEN